MKKAISIILCTAALAGTLAGCGSGKIKDAEIVGEGSDKPVPAITEKDGHIVRTDDGQIIVAVTNENGEAIKDDNGEVATSAVEVTHAVTMGDIIEYSTFSISVPKGWEPGDSYTNVNINSTDKNQNGQITIFSDTESKDIAGGENIYGMITTYEKNKVLKEETDTVTVAGVKAERKRAEIESSVIDTKVLVLYTFSGPSVTYQVLCYSKDADTDNSYFEDVINNMILY